ncbi:MAG: excinuclease ABC subunit UvrA [Paraprevotella sp.]|nr:excinuclease ABC subunit UvrA [Paraprevotella sp.]MDY5265842.1 excinuclease ABC subunit UvrA [Bacteroidaceae bacterium]
MKDCIQIKGARVNNLKNISLEIPRRKLVVVTGLSGSGKSSLAFDTLYAEGQRRYVESLSAYARQFLGRMHKPECDYIKGIPPAIAIEQKVTTRNPRSTVGTSTEIYEYLRLLYARVGKTFSPISGQEVKRHTTEDVVRCVSAHSEGIRFLVLCPILIRQGRSLQQQLDIYRQSGFVRLEYQGEVMRIEDFHHEEAVPGELYLVVDRLSVGRDKDTISRLTDSVETAFYEGGGEMMLRFVPDDETHTFSTRFEADGISFEEPSDNMFSFNSPAGACPDCEGFGKVIGIDEHLVIPNTTLSVYEGAVVCWRGEKMSEWKDWFIRFNSERGFPIFKPYYELTQEEKDWLWHGTFPHDIPEEKKKLFPEEKEWGLLSIDAFFEMLRQGQYKIQNRVMLARYRGKTICPKCHGTRLKAEANYVKVGGRSITELVEMPIGTLKQWMEQLTLTPEEEGVAQRIMTEIRQRLQFLTDVGLEYLTLNRPSASLSGGESQRINLATSLGSSLVGSLYILDEPSIGLHSRDTDKLIKVLQQLRDLGNTVIVVEHDEEIMRAADWIIDIGPEAGRLGGQIMYNGPAQPLPQEVEGACSHTLDYLTGREQIALPVSRRPWTSSLIVRGARENNLQGIDVEFPLNVMTCVTGVSGSGKSTLVRDILYRALKRHFAEATDRPGEHLSLEGDLCQVKAVEFVDQNPIGKSSRSNPVTYVKAWDEIRKLFAAQPLAKQMGYTAAYFSFNTDGGRCEECKGEGTVTVEMQFMADLTLPCESCHGKRFKHDILEVTFGGRNVYEVLEMTVNQAIEFFSEHRQNRIVNLLRPLQDVGLGYIKLGQSSSTLSGGENQRVKLAYYLGIEKHEPTVFIFDEPTTGLHFHDIRRLLDAFNALIMRGHTLIIIEHNLDVIKCADHVIDLGPEGGARGGQLLCCGTPEVVAQCGESYTARFLKEKLGMVQ